MKKVDIYFCACFCSLILHCFLDKIILIYNDFVLVSSEIQFVFNLENFKNMYTSIIHSKLHSKMSINRLFADDMAMCNMIFKYSYSLNEQSHKYRESNQLTRLCMCSIILV